MIVIKVELWPGGVKERRRTIARAEVANIGGDSEIGIYRVSGMEADHSVSGEKAYDRHFRIPAYDRRNSIWSLVGRVAQRMTADQ